MKKTPKLLRIAGAVKCRVLTGPRFLRIDIANKCNLKCPYCWYYGEGADHEEKKEFDFNLFKQIVDDAVDLNVEGIELSGEGEPFIHPKIKDMINYIHSKKKFFIHVNTNGSFPESMHDILPKIYYLRINLPAYNKESYVKVHGGKYMQSYRQILLNIASLSKNRDVPFKEIAYIIHKKNYKFIPDFVNFANKTNFEFIRFKVTSGFSMLNPEEKEELRNLLMEVLSKSSCKRQNNLQSIYDSLTKKEANQEGIGKKMCYIGYEEAVIAPSGDVELCCVNRCIRIGNVYEKSFKEIWNSKEYQKIRDFAANGFVPSGKWEDCGKWCEMGRFNSEMRRKIQKLKSLRK